MSARPYTQYHLSAFGAISEDEVSVPVYRESPLHLGDAESTLAVLKSIDWSFTDDDTRFLGHDIHPYPAKFIPQLPGTLISLLSSRGEVVFDPFGGSGTSALESIRLGRRAISLDANPVAALIGRVKTARMEKKATTELHLLHAAMRAFARSIPVEPKALVEKYSGFAPVIANREKWFPDSSFGELAHVRFKISQLQDATAIDIAYLALSRTVLSSSFQDSETRYKSVPREIPPGETTMRFIKEFESVMKSVARNAAATRYGVSRFLVGDVRQMPAEVISPGSVDLVVTSPPYGNAMDYHLYHRFRLLWLGHDPIAFGKLEIGSHLKHQRESSGFDTYFNDMIAAMEGIARVLKNGRYAVLIVGDSIYKGESYDTAKLLSKEAAALGFDFSGIINREVHRVKRSFTPAGRRASHESILVLRKTARLTPVAFMSPPYKLWQYEQTLRKREGVSEDGETVALKVDGLVRSRSMVFTHHIAYATGFREPTWQAILENGTSATSGSRKDPKYVTHGLHPYKGKFYPQLAKALINLTSLPSGARILDPLCGSGTTLLEGHLNGFETYGCDVNPLAAKIALAKTGILNEEPDVLSEVVSAVLDAVESPPKTFPTSLNLFETGCLEEILKWFADPVARKLNWVLGIIRTASSGITKEFLEVILSSIVRQVSQQDPTDLRIRYRKDMLEDADVLGMFREQLLAQFTRIEKFWKIRGYSPNPFYPSRVIAGDNRVRGTYDGLGLADSSVDLVLTSPPYAMALPYIDTDRLSLLTLFGLEASRRRFLEEALIGSREISGSTRKKIEQQFASSDSLPPKCIDFVKSLQKRVFKSCEAGFRKQNMPALIHRFLTDMESVLCQMHRLCKAGAEAMIVIGDSKMTIDEKEVRIPSTDFLELIAHARGFKTIERIDISVTTENLVHIKNAITENVVLRLRKTL